MRKLLIATVVARGDRIPLVNGVYADGGLEAARIARMAAAEGASALLVFPPNSMSMGGQLPNNLAIRLHRAGQQVESHERNRHE